ncbi:MerR family transcriptional regulator [Candidatus Obscuribacterales bacterium]|nr:MerR family transcriptional regulator [Candidatus Obscuribacterales bacterium]MBX3149259.1 MerR family transcriptional regulator [Candidatus Obscuribacterales bacterium]
MTVLLDNAVMVAERKSYSLNELSDEVARLLKDRGLMNIQHDQRVSAAPDKRTIRYYTTLGLLDRPNIEGRQAKYGDRHVMQLVAIKALQSVALPLSEIQSMLYGLTEDELDHVIDNVAESIRVKQKLFKKETFKTTRWRELVIEPGLKLVVEDDWQSEMDESLLFDRLKAALDLLKKAGSDGGSVDERDDE